MDGQSFNEIALQHNTSPRRIQQMMDLAFLAPDIVRKIIDGNQPHGLTSDWIEGHSLPADWDEQRQLMARL